MNTKLALFEEKEIRKIYKNNNWYYSVNDVISFLTNSTNPSEYLKKLKLKDIELQKNWNNLYININMQTKNGKIRKVTAANTIGLLRIIESISSPKAEEFKMWLARLGNERLEEINEPEIAMERMKKIYQLKGYSNSWIEQREREITSRHSLNEEWIKRGIKTSREYQILLNDIYKSNFGINISEYKKIKGINEISDLKDSMTNLELALTNLSEVTIAEIHNKNNSQGIEELKKDINEVGNIIINSKKQIEEKLDTSIISPENYMNLTSYKEQ